MKSIGKLLTMALVALMWSPIQAAYRISEEQRSKPLPIPPGLGQYDRPNRPVPPAPKPKESETHTLIDRGPTIPLGVDHAKKQETPEDIAQRAQDLERLKRMQRIEKTLGTELLLRPGPEDRDNNKLYKMQFIKADESSDVRKKLAQEDRDALKKEYDELKKIDEQRRAEIRAKAAEPVAKDEAVVAFEQAPARMTPSEAAAAQRLARKQPSDEISARDLKRMGREEVLKQGEELEKQAQAIRPPVPPRPPVFKEEPQAQKEKPPVPPRRPLAIEEAKTEPAPQPRKKEFTADDLNKIKQSLEENPQKIEKMKEDAFATPGFQQKYDAWMEKKDSIQQDQSKIEKLKDKFFAKTESAKDTIKEATTNFKNKIFGFFGRGKKASEEPLSDTQPVTPNFPPPPPEFLTPAVKKQEAESTGIMPSDKENRPTKESSSQRYGAVKMTPEQVEQARKEFGQEATPVQSSIPLPPPLPPLAPPLVERIPPAPPAAPVAKKEEPASGRADLLEQIRQGAQLKKVEPVSKEGEAQDSITAATAQNIKKAQVFITEKESQEIKRESLVKDDEWNESKEAKPSIPPPPVPPRKAPAAKEEKAQQDRQSSLNEIKTEAQLKPVDTQLRPTVAPTEAKEELQSDLAAGLAKIRGNMNLDSEAKKKQKQADQAYWDNLG